MTPRDRSLVEDILDNARISVLAFDGLTDQQVGEVPPLYTAAHAPMIVGEAASKLSDALKSSTAETPWRKIADTRNLIVHAYHKIDPVFLAGIVRRDLPPLIVRLEQLLQDDPE